MGEIGNRISVNTNPNRLLAAPSNTKTMVSKVKKGGKRLFG